MTSKISFISPSKFTQAMTHALITKYGLSKGQCTKLHPLWKTFALEADKSIHSHNDADTSKQLNISSPLKGTGIFNETPIYCAMLARSYCPLSAKLGDEQHPGVLLVTSSKAEADDLATTINGLAGRDGCYAVSYHSSKSNSMTLESLSTYPVLVITKSAYVAAVGNKTKKPSSTWPYYYAWQKTGRKLIAIEESLMHKLQRAVQRTNVCNS